MNIASHFATKKTTKQGASLFKDRGLARVSLVILCLAGLVAKEAHSQVEIPKQESSALTHEVLAARPLKANRLSLSLNSLGLGFGNSQGLFVIANPRLEYFVADLLALGIETPFSTAFRGDSTSLGLGFTATAYVFGYDHFALYIGTSYILNRLIGPSDTASSQDFKLHWGANYAPTEWFGVGPRLTLSLPTAGKESRSASVSLDFINLYFYL